MIIAALIILVTLMILAIVVLRLLLIRNDKVYDFRKTILEMCFNYSISYINIKPPAYSWFLDKYTYQQMMYSWKPLKIEVWYTPEEIEEINSRPNN